ncbi:hypothetical protein [Roseibium album]|uniref:hypothetical protein n=1 Tax=Roseibium album TaxID=311410 RepID=UPI0018CBA421|nr:hypothetical protein [Labrenzia sp. EL_126]
MDCDLMALSGCALPYLNVKSAAAAPDTINAAIATPAKYFTPFITFSPPDVDDDHVRALFSAQGYREASQKASI